MRKKIAARLVGHNNSDLSAMPVTIREETFSLGSCSLLLFEMQLTFIRDSPRVLPVFPSFRPCLQETWKAATKIARPLRFAFNARVRGSKGISLFRKLEQRNGSSNI
jgi:hypothetical protein